MDNLRKIQNEIFENTGKRGGLTEGIDKIGGINMNKMTPKSPAPKPMRPARYGEGGK